LINLFAIDQKWTKTNLLPYFKWNENIEATAMWHGYLWSPRISPDLLAIIKTDMLKALLNKEQLGDASDQICQLFAITCLEFPETFRTNEMREALKSVDENARSEISEVIYRRLEEAGKKREIFWNNRIKPWIVSVWPKDRAMLEDSSTRGLALTATAAGDEFEDAVKTICNYLKRIERFSFVVHNLESQIIEGKSLTEKYPNAALMLLDKIIPDDIGWPDDDLRKILEDVKGANPVLQETSAYRRIDEYLRRHNL
jgi:hypothetical protein